jgi:hypothetical protein
MTTTRYEITKGREVRAWGLSRRHAVQQIQEAASAWLAEQEPIRDGIPSYRRMVDDELAESGALFMWQQGVWGNSDAHVAAWHIREDGGVATHPGWPAFSPMTTTPIHD